MTFSVGWFLTRVLSFGGLPWRPLRILGTVGGGVGIGVEVVVHAIGVKAGVGVWLKIGVGVVVDTEVGASSIITVMGGGWEVISRGVDGSISGSSFISAVAQGGGLAGTLVGGSSDTIAV